MREAPILGASFILLLALFLAQINRMKKQNLSKKILIFNGSPGGRRGNCGHWIHTLEKQLKPHARTEVITLEEKGFSRSVQTSMQEADGMIFVTGTYWDSWGSPLQSLLEDMTHLEATSTLLGKPAAVFVLMHSVGGKSVLSRLQGVLSTLGFLIPPMSGMVYSLASDIALKSRSSFAKDFWQKEDSKLILENLLIACELKNKWVSWPVDKKDPRRRWLR